MSVLHMSFGPQHPGSGPLRLILDVDGDIVINAVADIGYCHRGIERLAENRLYVQSVPLVERICNIDSFNVSLGYVNAVEELMDVRPPDRALFIRVIMAELNRIMSHLYWFSLFSEVPGLFTPLFWGIADRELLLDLAEMVTGSRITYTYFLPGGVRHDLPPDFRKRAEKVLDYLERRLMEYNKMVYQSSVYQLRMKGVGVLRPDDAIRLGVTGPTLRGSGVRVDTRLDEPYAVYDQLDFDMAVEKEGDCYARAMVRFREIKESISIIRQALTKTPEGPISVRVPLRVKEGEAYSRVESARGELGYYVVSDGTEKPYRVKISAPSFRNLSALPYMLKGAHVADVPVILFSIDPWPWDSDR